MQLGFHFGFKKSKAYGLCGVMLAILFLGMSGQSAKADEMLSPTDTSSTLKESTDNHEASYSEVGVHDDSTSQMNLQSEKVLEALSLLRLPTIIFLALRIQRTGMEKS